MKIIKKILGGSLLFLMLLIGVAFHVKADTNPIVYSDSFSGPDLTHSVSIPSVAKPYPIRVYYTAHASATSGYWYWQDPWFRVDVTSPTGVQTIISFGIYNNTVTNSFDIPANQVATVYMNCGKYSTWFNAWGVDAYFQLTYCLDNVPPVSPSRPQISGSYYNSGNNIYTNGSVLLNWDATTDQAYTYQGYTYGPVGIKDYSIYVNGSKYTQAQNLTSRQCTLNLSQGIYDLAVSARDAANNESAPGNTTKVVVDTTPPTGSLAINNNQQYTPTSSVTLNLTANDATIGSTPGSGVSQMCFSNDGVNFTAWEAFATSKNWTLSNGVGMKTVYVKFKDDVGNVSISYNNISFIIPTLNITKPTNNSTIWNTVTVEADVYDPCGIKQIEFYLNGTLNNILTNPSSGTLFSYNLDTTTLIDGVYTLMVKLIDQSGYITSQSINFTIANQPPAINIISPLSTNLKGSICISTNTNQWVTSVEFYLDGVNINTSSNAPFGYTFDSSTYPNGNHTILVKAFNIRGDMSQSSVNVIFRNSIDIQQVQPLAPIN